MDDIPYGYCHCGCGQKTRIATEHRPNRGVFRGQPLRYIYHHGHAKRDHWDVIDRGYGTPCFIWKLTKNNKGYGMIVVKGKVPGRRDMTAHRYYYQKAYGPVPEGQVLHHLCEQKDCVRPDHLQAMSASAHDRLQKGSKRKTHCKRGHPLVGPDADVYRQSHSGITYCAVCARMRWREYYRSGKCRTRKRP